MKRKVKVELTPAQAGLIRMAMTQIEEDAWQGRSWAIDAQVARRVIEMLDKASPHSTLTNGVTTGIL